MYRMRHMPCGWKFFTLLCQLALQRVIKGIVPPHMIVFHYLDDFLLMGGSPAELKEVTRRVVEALKAARFLVSPRSVPEPTTRILFLGKHIDTQARRIWSAPRANVANVCAMAAFGDGRPPAPPSFDYGVGFYSVACAAA